MNGSSIVRLVKWLACFTLASIISTFLYLNMSRPDGGDGVFSSEQRRGEDKVDDLQSNHGVIDERVFNPKFDAVNFEKAKVEKTQLVASDSVKDDEIIGAVSYNVHIFYYPWYGNPIFDGGKYYHWNHKYLPHWQKEIAERYPSGVHTPPGDIGANFYPKLGAYSSRDPSVIAQHMKWIAMAGVGVAVVSWYPAGMADEQGHEWDSLIRPLMDAAATYSLKVAFHLEPYKGRTAVSVARDIRYLLDSYGDHPAFYRTMNAKNVLELPVFYVYDSYLVPTEEWKEIAMKTGKETIRGTKYDAILIGLLVKAEDAKELSAAGFDGLYTYFAADGFSYGSKASNWIALADVCDGLGLLFVPSVGPGYDDRRVRPWNGVNRRDRERGRYYEQHMEAAYYSRAKFVSITSFNEWHEGTQIEPAIPYTDGLTGFVYTVYDSSPEQYLKATKEAVSRYFPPNS